MKIPELLAPAGNLECALAAADAGADAVYCGLPRFNARARAENFDFDTMGKLSEFLHSRSKKLYLTFNTMLFEPELPEAIQLLHQAEQLNIDALIVQDPGVIHLVRRYFPALRLHASTQMGIHNSAGIKQAAELGMERVILERQVTPDELEHIVKNSPIEVEVFLHGSLCCSLSGRCLLSWQDNGGSGNRGCCKQPCRRAFTDPAGNTSFPLSMRDLNGVEMLPFFKRIGVASLKIEGRLRGPDYVWKCVHAYRILLDDHEKNLTEAKTLLRASSARNEISFFDPAGIIDRSRIGVFGREVARVEKISSRGILIKSTAKLHLGDRLRLVPPDGGDGESFSLIDLENGSRKIVSLSRGGMGFIPGKFNCRENWILYKIGENGFDFSRQAASLPPLRHEIRMEIAASAGKWRISLPDFPGAVWENEYDFAPARQHPAGSAEIAAAFTSGTPAPWRVKDAAVNVSGPAFFLPSAELKKIRRDFWEYMGGFLQGITLENSGTEKLETALHGLTISGPVSAPGKFPSHDFHIPGFIPEFQLPEWEEKIRRAIGSGAKIFRCGGLHALQMLKKYPECIIYSAFPMNITNSCGAALMKELGVKGAGVSPELPEQCLESSVKYSPIPLFLPDKKFPLLVSRADLSPSGIYRDREGRKYQVSYDRLEKLWKLEVKESQ